MVMTSTSMISPGQVLNNNRVAKQPVLSKVVWSYSGYSESVVCMTNKPARLCNWWIKQHRNDSQYAKGIFTVIPMEL